MNQVFYFDLDEMKNENRTEAQGHFKTEAKN